MRYLRAGMDWKVFGMTFATIFLAELGDKTQFAAMGMSASSGSDQTKEILLGVVLGLAVAGALGVLAGKVLGALIDPTVMRWISGGIFIGFGVWTLVNRS